MEQIIFERSISWECFAERCWWKNKLKFQMKFCLVKKCRVIFNYKIHFKIFHTSISESFFLAFCTHSLWLHIKTHRFSYKIEGFLVGSFSRDPGHVFPGNGNPKNPGIPGNFPSRDSRPTPLVQTIYLYSRHRRAVWLTLPAWLACFDPCWRFLAEGGDRARTFKLTQFWIWRDF